MTDVSRRATGPRHGTGATRGMVAGTARVIGIVLLVAVVSVAGVAAIGIWRIASEFHNKAVPLGNGAPPAIGAIDGAFNVLLVGEDNAPGQNSEGFGQSRDAALNDVNILVHVSADHEHATVVNFPRDLEIAQPECRDASTGQTSDAVSKYQLNGALNRGGLGCVVATIHALTGAEIPYAALFSFEGTVKMADAVGGVPVCVNQAVNDPKSGLVLPAGTSVITGRTALAYLRSRHGVGDGSDLGRIASQQAYMSSLMRTMTSAGTLSNPLKLYALADAAAKNTTLSDTLADPDTMVTMAIALKSVKLNQMVFVQYPAADDPDDADKVVPVESTAALLNQRIVNDQPIALDKGSQRYNSLVTGKSGVKKHGAKSTASASTTPSPVASPSPSGTPSDVVSGLLGQTAAQKTCSIKNPDE